ncbi:MAG TPA: HEPN domain-containing protein, partial [Thermoanaerobaculia bacterium]|nr:HEPN domain-containing protein [Thermoanaerobaculia bacterium]
RGRFCGKAESSMPHEPARIEDTKAWLTKAWRDLQAGQFELVNPALLGDVVFHAQQAAEKALKAFLTWHDIPFRKTHNIEEIGAAGIEIDASLSEAVNRAAPLTEYAWRFRYPGEPEEPAVDEATEALSLAREIYQAVLARLPEEAQPRDRPAGG